MWIGEWRHYVSLQSELLDIFHAKGQPAAIAFYNGSYRDLFLDFRRDLDTDLSFYAARGSAEADAGRASYDLARHWIFLALGFAAALCFAAGSLLVYSVSRPLGALTGAVDKLAAGEMNVEVPETGRKDEVGKLAGAMAAFKVAAAERARNEQDALLLERAKAEQTAMVVSSLGAGLEALAREDFSHRITADLQGDFSKLKSDFNATVSRLQKSIETEREKAVADQKKADQITRMLTSIAAGFKDLSGDLKTRLGEAFAPEFEQLRVDFNDTVTSLQRKIQTERALADGTNRVVTNVASGLKQSLCRKSSDCVERGVFRGVEPLRTDFNTAISRLHDTVRTVQSATSGISSGADEISHASDDLSKRTEQQAASLEETAAALEQISATVKKTARNAADASKSVSTAKSAAENGGQIVDAAIAAMRQIEHSSIKSPTLSA